MPPGRLVGAGPLGVPKRQEDGSIALPRGLLSPINSVLGFQCSDATAFRFDQPISALIFLTFFPLGDTLGPSIPERGDFLPFVVVLSPYLGSMYVYGPGVTIGVIR